LRYGIPYGPRMRDELVIPIFMKKALSGQSITITGDGSQYRNFIYVEDLAEAHVLALDEKATNQIYNLEGMRRISIRDIAETLDHLLGGVKIEYLPARPGDYKGKEVSGEKIKRELGWAPTVDFEEGMQRTLDWYRQRLNV
jgi:UDP-glucose 4-epimerase